MSKNAACHVDDCENDAITDSDFCALHIDKNDYSQDFNSLLLMKFYDQFVEYLVGYLYKFKDPMNELMTRDQLAKYLKEDNYGNEDVNEALKKEIVILTKIKLPARDSRDHFDYLKLLNLFGGIQFHYCEFFIDYLALNGVKCSFQDCKFYLHWSLYDFSLLENANSVLYQSCHFYDLVSSYNFDDNKKFLILSSDQFTRDCIFEKALRLESTQFEGLLFNIDSDQEGSELELKNIPSISITKCVFDNPLKINKFSIKEFVVKNSKLNAKLEFKENEIQQFYIENTNFKKLSDFYMSQFVDFKIERCIFDDFVGFELCQVGKDSDDGIAKPATFRYVTFLNFINFRCTHFFSGLDIENINLKESPNFLNVWVSLHNTNRETIRIIKHSFEKTGNLIEANKFFSLEMKKYKEELKKKKWWSLHFQEKLLFNINDFVSGFGQSYLKPVCLIFLLAGIYWLLVQGYEANLLYEIFPPLNSTFSKISTFFNTLALNILPFKSFLKEGMEFLSLVFYIGFTVLIWQTFTAVKIRTIRG